MNKIFLIGNLTRDPELTETSSGVAVCNFSIAVNRRQGQGEQQTDFFGCTAWRGLAETIVTYCKKGNKVAVVGSLRIQKYDDRDGVQRTKVNVNVDDIEFLTPKGAAEPAAQSKPKLEEFDDDSDIPF